MEKIKPKEFYVVWATDSRDSRQHPELIGQIPDWANEEELDLPDWTKATYERCDYCDSKVYDIHIGPLEDYLEQFVDAILAKGLSLR